MADLTSLQKQLDALMQAYRSGVRTVEYEGRSTSYVSGEDMRAAIASLRSEIAQITGTAAPTIGVIRATKGY